MIKSFGETFPTLKVDSEMEHLLEKASVTKISVNHARNLYRIYLTSERLIFKKNIWKLEEAIQKQIFKSKDISVKIIESYQLSTQYTPRTLLDVYKDSILDELNSHSVLLYNLLRTAQWEFTDDTHVTLTIEETIIAKTRGNTIMEFLEKVFCERCGMDFIINIKYEKPKISKYRKNADKQIEQEVQNIIARTKFAVAGNEDIKTAENQNQDDDGSMFVEAGVSKPKNDGKMSEKVKKERKTPETSDDSSKNDRKFERKFEKRGDFRRKYDNDPDMIYGRNFDDEEITIDKIDGPIGEVVIKGQILSVETRNIRNEKTIIIFAVTDFTDTIMLKLFVRTEDVPEITKDVADGKFIKVKGVVTVDKYDSDLSITSIAGIKKIPDFTTKREDTAAEKRVELHCHTKMSDMDGVSDVKDIVKCAMRWGHKAIAITDHGDVQAFPDANHTVDDKFKVIYGVEAYLVDDTKDIVEEAKGQKLDDSYVVFDIETTGFSPEKNKIIEIGAVKVVEGKIVDRYSTFVNPQVPIPFRIEELTSIRDDMVVSAPTIDVILPDFMEFCKDCIMVAHNADFDMSFIKRNCELLSIPCNPTIVDTVALARVLLPQLNRFKLDTVAKAVGVSLDHHHRAVDDAACTAEIFVKFIQMLKDRGVDNLDEVNQMAKSSVEMIRKMPTYHAIILATCDQGRTNLYRLTSLAHIKYYNKRPRIPKSEFVKYHDGLLIGSACEAGELYRAILNGRPQEEINRLVNFYDYLEIQPLGNNAF
ncbi:MAG: PHP domain-containing protein, partial [[Eubacterium] rectale]|nr:PHP domain-containing protein [Agathobacter rectalis]